MVFAKRLRDGVRRGEITCSVRIWTQPHVKVGNRYRIEEGEIEVDSIKPIGLPDITPELARESGFLGVVDLLKVAKHGRGENIYLVRFHLPEEGSLPLFLESVNPYTRLHDFELNTCCARRSR